MRSLQYFICFFVWAFCVPTGLANTVQQTLSADGWLQSLVITIPPTTLSSNGFTLSISENICRNISLNAIDSSLPTPLSIQISLSGIGIICYANWTAYETSTPDVQEQGDVVSWAGGSSTMEVQMVRNASNGLVVAAETSNCYVGVNVTDIEFYGAGPFNASLEGMKPRLNEYTQGELGSETCSKLADLTDDKLTTAIQNENDKVVDYVDPTPLDPPYDSPDSFVNFVDNPYVGAMDFVADTLVGADGPLGLNTLVNSYTNNTGSFLVPNATALTGSPLQRTVELGNYAAITIGLIAFNITGLNTWGDVEMFEPIGNYTLELVHTVLTGVAFSMHVSLEVAAGGGAEGPSTYEEVIMQGNLSQIALHSQLYLGLMSPLFQKLAANQLTSPGCLLRTINTTQILLVAFNFTMGALNVIPLSANGPVKGIDQLITNLADLGVTSFAPILPAAINGFIFGFLAFINDIIPTLVLPKLVKAHACAAPQAIATDTFNQDSTFYSLIGAAGLFLIIGIVTLFLKYRGGDQQSERVPFLGGSTPPLPRGSEALIMSNEIPFLVRYGILVVLLANVALFISSNTSIGASVYLVIDAKGEKPIQFPSLFDFSLGNSVRDMWNAKVYALSILIAVFSGCWPYIKLAMLIACWIIPGRIFRIVNRERILLFLDALGKCSLIDSFVLILMMVAFHFSITPTVTRFTPPGTLVVQTWVQPHYGFYSFVIATILSLLITHAINYCHRKASEDLEDINESYHDEDKKSLLAYSRKTQTRSSMLPISVVPLLVVALAMVVVGAIISSFEFEFKGAFGYLLTLLGRSTTTSYSVLSLGSFIPSSSVTPHNAGIIFLQVSFFIFVIAMPLLYLSLLILLWLWPLSFRAQRRLLHITEIAQAWSSLEVFVVAIIAALLELQQFAQFIIGDRCDKINPLLQKYAHNLIGGDDKCFDVVASLKTGCWVMFAACVLYLCVGLLVIRSCHKALASRLKDLDGTSVNR